MNRTLIPKALRKQAALRALKTPDVLAQQAALNGVLLGRKSGTHRQQATRQSMKQKIRVNLHTDDLLADD